MRDEYIPILFPRYPIWFETENWNHCHLRDFIRHLLIDLAWLLWSDKKRGGYSGESYNGIEIKKYFLQWAFYSEVNNYLKYKLSTSAFPRQPARAV